jgi:multiple sugar transport system substrate-binding protein
MLARRETIRNAIVLAVAVLCTVLIGAVEAADFDWGRFKGKDVTIRMIDQKRVWSTLVSGWLPEFEGLTGIKVQLDVLPQEQYNQRIGVEAASGAGQIDIFTTLPGQEGIKLFRAGFVTPVDEYLRSPNLTAADFDPGDFMKPAFEGMRDKGMMFALPVSTEVGMLFYRKDLFEKHGVKVPATMDELEQAAKTLTIKGADGKVEVYGVVNRGRKEAAGGGWASSWLHNHGGDWLDQRGNPMLNSPEAVRGWEAYTRIVRLYGPPGQTAFQWHEAASFFSQGRAAMLMENNLGAPLFNDPEKSKIVGKVGYAKVPAGPARDTPHLVAMGLCLSNSSKNKEAAWLLMQWLTNKRQQLRAQIGGVPTARVSAWDSPEFRAADRTPEWTRVSLASMRIANAQWLPPIVAAFEAKEVIGALIQAGILGEHVSAAANKANAELKSLIEKTEKP